MAGGNQIGQGLADSVIPPRQILLTEDSKPPVAAAPRVYWGWIALGWMLVTVISMSLSQSLDKGSRDQFFALDQDLKHAVHSESLKTSPLSNLPVMDDGDKAPSLQDLERKVAKVRYREVMGSVLYAAILSEEHKPIPQSDIDRMKKGKEPGTRAMGEIFANKSLSVAQANSLIKQLKKSNLFVTDLAQVIALEKAGDKKARARIIRSPSMASTVVLALGGLALMFGCVACWCGYAASRAMNELSPAGVLHPQLNLPQADRFAVRAAQVLFAFLGLELAIGLLMGKAPQPIQTIVQGLAMLVAVWLLQRYPVGGESFSLKRLGISRENLGTNILWGVGGFLGELPVAMVLAAITTTLLKFLPEPEHPASVALTLQHDPLTIISLLFAGTIVAPIWEEIMFRGLLFPALSTVFRRIPIGAIVSSLIFASVHPQGIAIWASLATTGLMSCALVYQTKSLVPSIVMHFCHNLVLMGLTILVS